MEIQGRTQGNPYAFTHGRSVLRHEKRKGHLHGFLSSITHKFKMTGIPPQSLTLSCTVRRSATRIPSSLTRSRLRYEKPFGSAACGWSGLSCFPAPLSEDGICDSPTCTGGDATFPKVILGRNRSNRRSVSGKTNHVHLAQFGMRN